MSDLDLDELTPVDAHTSRAIARLADWDDPCVSLARYEQRDPQQPGRSDHFHLVHDEVMAQQGKPFFAGVHLEVDQKAGLFRVTVRDAAMPVLTEAWLIARGADPDQLRERIRSSEFSAADADTEATEDLLRHAGTRFDVHDSASSADTPFVTWVIATDNEAPDADRPVALIVGSRQADSETFALRLGYFPSIQAAYDWTRNPNAPLPQPGRPATARADAALLHHRGTALPGTAGTGTATPTAPDAGTRRPSVR